LRSSRQSSSALRSAAAHRRRPMNTMRLSRRSPAPQGGPGATSYSSCTCTGMNTPVRAPHCCLTSLPGPFECKVASALAGARQSPDAPQGRTALHVACAAPANAKKPAPCVTSSAARAAAAAAPLCRAPHLDRPLVSRPRLAGRHTARATPGSPTPRAAARAARRLQDVPLRAAGERQDALGAQHIRRARPALPQQRVQPRAQPARAACRPRIRRGPRAGTASRRARPARTACLAANWPAVRPLRTPRPHSLPPELIRTHRLYQALCRP